LIALALALRPGAHSWSCSVADASFAAAVMVTVMADATAVIFAVKEMLAAFRGTVTLDGTDTAELLLVRDTVNP
jgi:hypothetical protein